MELGPFFFTSLVPLPGIFPLFIYLLIYCELETKLHNGVGLSFVNAFLLYARFHGPVLVFFGRQIFCNLPTFWDKIVENPVSHCNVN
jgi:hypothetical protein